MLLPLPANAMMEKRLEETEMRWYALRDLSRPNAKNPAYLTLAACPEMEGRVFTPMVQRVFNEFGKRVVRLVPYVHDLLFAHQSRNVLDPIVEKIDLLQYRFVRGGRQYEAMTVRDEAMEQFIRATKEAKSIEYYATEEVSPLLYGKKIRIVGGRLDGLQGRLMSRRGSKTKRIILDLEECSLSAAVEVEAEYIQIIKEL